MKNLVGIFGNLFAAGAVASDLHTKNFSEDLLVRITHYNDLGQYDVMLNDTQAAHTAFFGEITSEDILKALRMGRTRSVDIIIDRFKTNISHYEDVINVKYLKEDPKYIEVFPQGVTEYSKASKTNITVLFTRIGTWVTTNAAGFDPAFVTEVSGYLTDYNTARGEQLDKKQDVKAAIFTSADARTALELQLSKNLLNLAIEFMDEPAKGCAFFNQNLLNPTHRHPQGEDSTGIYTLAIPVGVKKMAEFQLIDEPDYYLLISNTGACSVYGYTCADETGLPVAATPFMLEPGESMVYSYIELGSKPNLFFYTESPDTEGEVTIDQVDSPIV